MAQYGDKIAAGVAFLNGENPNWFNEVDTKTLDMASCIHCIGGQIFSHYGNMLEKLPNFTAGHGFGFSLPVIFTGAERQHQYQILTEEWVAQIEFMREVASLIADERSLDREMVAAF